MTAEIELGRAVGQEGGDAEGGRRVQQRESLQLGLCQSSSRMRGQEEEATRYTTEAELYAALRKRAEPLPVVDGKVVIHPIKWAPAGGK